MSLFSESIYLFLGLGFMVLTIIIFLISLKIKKKRLHSLTSEKLLPRLIPAWSTKQQIVKFIIFLASLNFLFFGLARPQWGKEQRKNEPTGIDILIALDVSKSMLARDVRPNRLERVKLSIDNQIDRVASDRLGLIAFSGSAFLSCPLTLDHQAFSKTLNDLKTSTIKTQGTNLANPIKEALFSFSKDDTDRFLILLSDGEDLEGMGLKEAREAAKKGIKIYTIGIGSKTGARIPLDPLDKKPNNFLKSPNGQTIISQLDDSSLRAIAEATGGQYYLLGPTGEGLAKVLQILQKIGQQKKREQLSTELPIERYQLFLIIGFFLLCTEMLTAKTKKNILLHSHVIILMFLLFSFGCFKQDNVKNAEQAIESGKYSLAGDFFSAEINSSQSLDKEVDPKLFLNAGLAYLEAGQLEKSEEYLDRALDDGLSDPPLQSKSLNGLGNIYYQYANQFLDKRDVKNARIAWEKAREFYLSSNTIDKNEKAKKNLQSLDTQLKNRIDSMITKINGKIWRDLDGDGKFQKKEPLLEGVVFWDKDQNGEHNKSNEPAVRTDKKGNFAFEWISDQYPTSIRLGAKIEDFNISKDLHLVPILPAPPPPENPQNVKNYYLEIREAGNLSIRMPFRSAPSLQGTVWKDENGDGERNSEEKGYNGGKLFLDQNGNFVRDENETSFEPSADGSFNYPVRPGQYSLCVEPTNPDANITFPIEVRKAHLAWTGFESPSIELDFGIQDNQKEDSNSSNSSNNKPSPPEEQDNETGERNDPSNEEVNALYERLLQETESKSEPLDQKIQAIQNTPLGRDY